MAAPTKAEQDAEALNRANAGLLPGEGTNDAIDTIGDNAPPADRAARAPGDPPQPAPPPVKGKFDDRRAEIVARFRTEGRGQQVEDQTDDISQFARSGLPPEFAMPQPEPIEQPDAQLEPEPQPQAPAPKIKLKVRGQEVEMTLDEVIAKAQIATASDDYLGEAKNLRDQAEVFFRQARDGAPRPAQTAQHPDGQNGSQTADQDAPTGEAPQHPEGDPLTELIETIQFGDPTKARGLLDDTLSRITTNKVNEALQTARLRDEGARTAEVLDTFKTQHPELANDPMAGAAIERRMYDLQIDDLKKLGVDPSKIPTESGKVTPADIAVAHRYYRANGFKVRGPADMLEQATNDFVTWKGGDKTVDPTTPQAPPRIEVRVDRDQRRQSIPQQPSRTAPPRTPAQQPPQQRDRSSIVQDMLAARNKPRGRVVA